MTVATTANKIKYTGNGSTTEFAFPYPVLDASHLKVYVVDTTVDPETETLKTLTTHYTLSAVPAASVTVTMLTAPTSTEELFIYRSVPFTQTTDLVNNGPLPEETLETTYDKIVMMCQQLLETLSRIPTLQISSDFSGLVIPALVANGFLHVKADGTTLEWFTGDDTTYLPISGGTMGGPIDMDENQLSNIQLVNVYGKTYALTSASGTATVNQLNGNNQHLTLSENTTIAFSNAPATGNTWSWILIVEQPAGQSHTLAFPASCVDDTGATFTPTAVTAEKMNVYVGVTFDGGTTYIVTEKSTGITPP